MTAGFIGATSAAADFFNGSIDEVRIYDRALTALEVSSLALGRTPGTSIATHTFADAYTAAIGTNIADLVIASGTITGTSTLNNRGELAQLRRALHRHGHGHADGATRRRVCCRAAPASRR